MFQLMYHVGLLCSARGCEIRLLKGSTVGNSRCAGSLLHVLRRWAPNVYSRCDSLTHATALSEYI